MTCLRGVLIGMVIGAAGVAAAVEGDIQFARKPELGAEPPPAVFPHWVHRMRFKCYVCHDAIFQMKAGTNPVTMESIQQGKYCGNCHDGKTAFAVGFDSCPRCHLPPQKSGT
jgi:c(7)-type cytochrome triheme protein